MRWSLSLGAAATILFSAFVWQRAVSLPPPSPHAESSGAHGVLSTAAWQQYRQAQPHHWRSFMLR